MTPDDPLGLDPQGPHRDRLLAAVAEAVRSQGFAGTTVADVVGRAKTSRRTFYEHFADLPAAYLALLEAFDERLLAAVVDAAGRPAPWTERIDATLGAYLGFLAAEPQLTRSFVQDAGALGPLGAAHIRRVVDEAASQLSRIVGEAAAHDPSLRPLPFDAAVVLVGGLRHIAIVAIADDRPLLDLQDVCGDLVRRLTLAAAPG